MIWIIAGAVIGGAMGEGFGLITGAVIGYLMGMIRRLNARIQTLEKHIRLSRQVKADAPGQAPKTIASRTPDARPAPAPKPAVSPPSAADLTTQSPTDKKPAPATAAQPVASTGTLKTAASRPVPVPDATGVAMEKIKAWIVGGNPVTRIGLIVLFCGVAFLLKYAAARNMLPIELRLAGVMAGGITLVTIGWRLRAAADRRTYALLLQGGGIGVIYLTLFAAGKIYHLVPLPLGLLLMLGMVGFSAALAIGQNALPLAQFGAMGGFLAPVLMSTGSGNHVLLFSYYALLNAGVFAIAWFRSWRSLNLTGFLFTFGIGSLWGVTAYAPRHFATTFPFLLLFFLFYVGISILYALRQPPRLKGLLDGTLVFGLPLLVFTLQSALVYQRPYGLAFSALGMGAFYVLLAMVLWHHQGTGLRLLVEAFLALGVVFSSVAIPLGLDDQWTTGAWAMEGAALVWVGVRQNRRLARWLGLLLQAGAGFFFAESLSGTRSALPVINGIFLCGGLISVAGLFSGIYLYRRQDKLMPQELALPALVALWGLLWWFGMGLFEIERQAPRNAQIALDLGFVALSLYALLLGYRRLAWPMMRYPLLALLPVMTAVASLGWILDLFDLWTTGHQLTDFGLIAWPLAFVIQYRLLYEVGDQWPASLSRFWHFATFLLLISFITTETDWLLRYLLSVDAAWRLAALMGIVISSLALLLGWRERRIWPLTAMPEVYAPNGWAAMAMAAIAWMLCLLTGLHNADPPPLSYLPLINPVEIGQMLILIALAYHLRLYAILHTPDSAPSSAESDAEIIKGLVWALAAAIFIFLNVVAARSVHHFGGTPYDHSLINDGRLRATISILWAVIALGSMAWGARHRRRPVWFAGAGLLGCGVAKLFFMDLAGSGGIPRIVSFLAVGALMLMIGFFAPLPPIRSAAAKKLGGTSPGGTPEATKEVS